MAVQLTLRPGVPRVTRVPGVLGIAIHPPLGARSNSIQGAAGLAPRLGSHRAVARATDATQALNVAPPERVVPLAAVGS